MTNETGRQSLTKRIIIGAAIALVLLFIVFLFITTNFLGNNMIVTETAYRATAYDVVKTNAIAVRDEEYIESPSGGILVYDATDGDKIIAGGTIATVYSTEDDVRNTLRMRELDDKIAYLEDLNTLSKTASIALDTVNSRINEQLISLMAQVNSRAFRTIPDVEDELMTNVFRKQIITGEQGKFSDKIEALKSERESLSASTGNPSGTVTTASSGYFVGSVDGYESCVDVSNLDTFYYSDYQALEPAKVDTGKYIGKIIKGVNWYLMCPVTADEATNISRNSSNVSVRLPYAMSGDIPAKVLYVNELADQDKSIVVLQCSYMNDALSKIRSESVEIVIDSYEGLKISKSAIHDSEVTRTVEDENGKEIQETKVVQGVYVEYGNELRFRQIVIEYSGDDYVICQESPDQSLLFTGTVTLYDRVVIEGGDLYDGKLIK